MGKKKKKESGLTLEDVANMKFDPPLTELECFIGISERARRERERKALEEEENSRENPGSASVLARRDQELFNERLRLRVMRDSSFGLDISKGEGVMGKKTNLKHPAGNIMGKKKEVLARDVTEDDITDLNPHSSEFDKLVHVAMKARELYEEAAKKSKISEEEEPLNEEFHCPTPEAAAKRQRMLMREKNLKKTLEIENPNRVFIANQRKLFECEDEEEEEPLNEEFHCPTPEAAAKRQRMLMREKNLKKPLEIENPKRVFIANQRKLFECEEEEEGDAKVVKKKNRTDNCKEVKSGVLPKEILDKIKKQNGSKVKLVIQKKLFETDLRSSPNRLSMPLSQLQEPDFLTEDEQYFLRGRTLDGKNTNGIPVLFIEPNGDLNSELVLKWWNMHKEPGKNTSSIYLFNGKWHDVFVKHKLDKNMVVQVWSFRYARDNCNGKLGFAMVIVERLVANGDRSRNAKGNKNDNENGKGKGKGNGSSGTRSETGGSQSGE